MNVWECYDCGYWHYESGDNNEVEECPNCGKKSYYFDHKK